MKTTKLNFQNSKGETLSARLEMPVDTKPHNFALFAHCFTCNKNLNAVRNIAKSLTQEGIAVLRFDFTGLGESEGDFADTNFSSNVADLVCAADYLRDYYKAPSILIGHSLGGAAVLVAKHQLPSVKAVATIGSPYHPAHVSHLLESGKEEIEKNGIARVSIGGRPFHVKKQFLEELDSLSSNHQIINSLDAALLVAHSPQDTIVGIDNATQIYKAAQHPRSFISLDGADHLLSKKEDSLYVGEAIAVWAKRYMEIPEPVRLQTGEQVIVRTGEGYTSDIKVRKHHLVADEPEEVGGNDFGPGPYEYLLASLGACTGMTLRMYANRKNWDLQEVRVHLSHNKVYIQDSESSENQGAKLDKIEKVIELEGNLDDTQRKRLIEMADRCPVHRTLHSEVMIETKVK